MKKVAVFLMASVVLAMSTAAFAVPVSVTINMPAESYDYTVPQADITSDTSGVDSTHLITWFQPYSFTAALPDLSGMPDGGLTGTLSAPDVDITSAVMTVKAQNVGPGQIDTLSLRPGSSGSWTVVGNLVGGPAWDQETTTLFTLSPTAASLFEGTSGVNARVQVASSNQGDYGKSSRLQATTAYSYVYTYDDGTEPPEPVIPAPGAILLASMGAGLVSWLRARKVL